MSEILITGASGLVGSAIYRCLSKNITGILSPTHKEMDLTNSASVDRYFNEHKINSVYHCAGLVSGIVGNATSQYNHLMQNALIGLNLINKSVESDVLSFVNFGSTCIYPKNTEQPILENSLLTSSLEPTNEGYALAKIASLKACQYANKEKGLFYISVMPTNIYGIGDKYSERSHVFPAIIQKVAQAKANSYSEIHLGGTGNAIRSFIFSDDVADISVKLSKTYFGSEPINIGQSEGISIRELAETIARVADYTGKLLFDLPMPDGTPIKIEDNTKLLSIIGKDYPFTPLEEGIKVTLDDYKTRYLK